MSVKVNAEVIAFVRLYTQWYHKSSNYQQKIKLPYIFPFLQHFVLTFSWYAWSISRKKGRFSKRPFSKAYTNKKQERPTNEGWYFNAFLAYEGQPFYRPNTLPSYLSQIFAKVSAQCRNACFFGLNNLSNSCVTLQFNAKQKKLAVSSIVSHDLDWPT